MRVLLDVNVLIALLDSDHVHHVRAHDWLRAHGKDGWASCPITQNGCVRIMSQPAYPNPLPAVEVIERLGGAARHVRHEFWADDCSLLDPRTVHADRVHGPKQVTDIYLLALAVRHKGCLLTFDGTVPLSAVPGATRSHIRAL
jgi:toxin-antitoxin system PIN domain toxin